MQRKKRQYPNLKKKPGKNLANTSAIVMEEFALLVAIEERLEECKQDIIYLNQLHQACTSMRRMSTLNAIDATFHYLEIVMNTLKDFKKDTEKEYWINLDLKGEKANTGQLKN